MTPVGIVVFAPGWSLVGLVVVGVVVVVVVVVVVGGVVVVVVVVVDAGCPLVVMVANL